MRRLMAGFCFLAMVLVFLILISDFVLLHNSQSRFERSFDEVGTSSPLFADLELAILSYDAATQDLSIRTDLSIFSASPLRDLAFSMREEPESRRRRWELYNLQREGVATYETLVEERLVQELKVSDVQPLALAVVRPPLFYPFDAYQTQICTACCANNDGEPCVEKSYVPLRKLQLDFGPLSLAPGFRASILESSPGTFLVKLKRQPFIRIVSIVLLLLSICFLGYLLFCQEGEDLMKGALGYFGALWALRSLIVPASIELFPTVVDYAIITLFCTLFLGVFVKTILKGGQNAIPMPAGDTAPVDLPATPARDGSDIRPRPEPGGSPSAARQL